MAFPEDILAREEYYLERIRAGSFDVQWWPITYTADGHTVEIVVFHDALKIDSTRINVTARGAQRIADVLDASLPTAFIADLMYARAVCLIAPKPRPISSSVKDMQGHSQAVEAGVLTAVSGLRSTVGKHWILHPSIADRPDKACNYGWHFDPTFQATACPGIKGFPTCFPDLFKEGTPSNVQVIQPAATAHNAQHADYSQICQLVSQIVMIDGAPHRFEVLLQDPILSKTITGGLTGVPPRQPGVAREPGAFVSVPSKPAV